MAMFEAMSQINEWSIFQVAPFPHRFIRSAREAPDGGPGLVWAQDAAETPKTLRDMPPNWVWP
jgi:hypothetical protein